MPAKLHPLILLFAASFVVPLGEAVILKRIEPMGEGAVIQTALSAIAIYWWYYLDKTERAFRAGTLQNMGVAVISVVGIPVYLFRSRGFKRGILASLVAFVTLVTSGAVSYLGELIGFKIAL